MVTVFRAFADHLQSYIQLQDIANISVPLIPTTAAVQHTTTMFPKFSLFILSFVTLALAAPLPQAGGAPDINSIIASLRNSETGQFKPFPTRLVVPTSIPLNLGFAEKGEAQGVDKRVFTGGAPPLNPDIVDRLKQLHPVEDNVPCELLPSM
ncbi:hypothetical protein BDY19DRAFT_620524 [Irpex rosettiformis]|uniref:Uncharacterized protein n=1 Tax=Irpex rosettiformis TaxID=378272 RepID=A0ACB8TPE4_9APHY|nr:hypothetical protein BDY19DRAFT_620524 [Irpex rosettiformis]